MNLKYPNKVCFTAITYFRRFFFIQNPLEYNPYIMAVVCIFLAAKNEELKNIDLDKFLTANFKQDEKFYKFNLTTQLIKHLEIELCKTLNFEFMVHNPINCIKYIEASV